MEERGGMKSSKGKKETKPPVIQYRCLWYEQPTKHMEAFSYAGKIHTDFENCEHERRYRAALPRVKKVIIQARKAVNRPWSLPWGKALKRP